jgi:23S rRNA (pseudouridine1915-N3)-methyltransferase
VRYVVLAVGRLRPPFADDAEHYRKLLSGHARVEELEVRDEGDLERRLPERGYICVLDRDGRALDSVAFARWLEERRQAGRDVWFVVGGPDGAPVSRCDQRLSFGPITLPHQLARIVLLEQLYRGHQILAGHPYHR